VKYPPSVRLKTLLKPLFLAIGLAALAGCSLPTQGPSARAIVENAEVQEYELLSVSDAVAKRLSSATRHGFSSSFTKAPMQATDRSVGIGDRLNIRIFEAGRDGLFSSDRGNGIVNLPNIVVGPDGLISLPYAGQIHTIGRSPRQIEMLIVEALEGKAIEPQATVEIAQDASNSVTVLGAVARPNKFPLNLRGERLSAALVAAGGARNPAYATSVKITRQGKSSTASLERIYSDPSQNIPLRKDDTVTVLHRPESYTIMGAVNRPGDIPFDQPSVTLLEAIGKSSGLLDQRADPGAVFLFRQERQSVLAAHGVGRKAWWGANGAVVPTVYVIDLSAPKALFHAQTIQLRDGDAIYVANASATQLSKILALFGLGFSTALSAQNLSN
jgi:polysaccharide export outer membrane protein